MPRLKYTIHDFNRIKELHDGGMSQRAIAIQEKMSPEMVYWLLKKGHRLPKELPKPRKAAAPKRKPIDSAYFQHDPYYSF